MKLFRMIFKHRESFHKSFAVLFQIFLRVIVVSSDVKIIVVFPPAGIAMATKIARMALTKPIAPPSLARKTNLSVPRAVPMPHPNAQKNPNCVMETRIATMGLMNEMHVVSSTYTFFQPAMHFSGSKLHAKKT